MSLPNGRPRARFLNTFLVVALFLVAGFAAGCAGTGKKDAGEENKPPTADIKAEKAKGWSSEQFTFDATGSKDPDGNISSYRFDFGDNQFTEKTAQQEPKADHRYAQGGEYTVTVTVTDNGGEKSGSLSASDHVNVAVNERMTIASHALEAPSAGTPSVNGSTPFQTHRGADRMEADVKVRNALAIGSTEVVVRVRSPDNQTLDEETATVQGGQEITINLASPITNQGEHEIQIEAKSGSGVAEGEVRVFYDAGF